MRMSSGDCLKKMVNYRKKALEHYEQKCDICGKEKRIEIHHRDGDRTNNSIDNLRPLCKHCHTRVHNVGESDAADELKPVEERGHISADTETLQISLDDADAERAKSIKNDRGLTWAEYIEAAAESLEGDGDAD